MKYMMKCEERVLLLNLLLIGIRRLIRESIEKISTCPIFLFSRSNITGISLQAVNLGTIATIKRVFPEKGIP